MLMDNTTNDRDVWTDAVSHQPVDPQGPRLVSLHMGKWFHFESADTKAQFDEDPELWASTPHASVESAHLSPFNEPE